MDTNKNVGINEFSGGMNSDLNYNTLQHNLYVYGENIRLTSNALINQSENPDKKEGVVAPIPEGILIKSVPGQFEKILAIEQIDNICVVIVEKIGIDYNTDKEIHYWSLYRITYNSDGIDISEIFTSSEDWGEEIPRFSTVINKEVNGIIKLYIADGRHEIMVININSEFDDYNEAQTETSLISNGYFPKNKIKIINIISGQLPVGQVQYTYRFYKKYGIKSKLAPLTNKILVISSAKNREQGNAEDTTSSMGLQLSIEYDSECATLFDKIQIFRIYYKKPNVDADIELIYDEKISNQGYIKLNDVGKDALKLYSAEEFVLLDGQDIIPQCIEHNQGYMFAANVIDKTIINDQIEGFDARAFSANEDGDVILYRDLNTEYVQEEAQWMDFPIADVESEIELSGIKDFTLNKYADMNVEASSNGNIDDVCRYDKDGFLGGTGRYVSWRFVTTKIPIDNVVSYESQLPPNVPKSNDEPLYYLKRVGGEIQEVLINENERTIKDTFNKYGVLANTNISYNDVFVSSLMRSLRRDEVYRYGIILYDENGRRSDVNWIADIKTPTANEFSLIKRELTSDDQFANVTSYVSNGGVTMNVGRVDEDENKVLFGKSITSGSDSFNTEAGQYLYCDEDSITAILCRIRISHADLQKTYEFQLQDPTNIANLASTITNDLSYTEELGDALRNITFTASNIMVHLDENTVILPIDEYNNSNNRLLAHSNTWVSIDFNASFEITAKLFSVELLVTYAYRVYVSDEKLESSPESEKIYAKPIGVEFNVKNLPDNIVGYQIVRCSKEPQYRKNIMLCVAALPIRQLITENEYSPYYPHYLLTTNPYTIKNHGLFGFGRHGLYGKLTYADTDDPTKNEYDYYNVVTDNMPKLFLLYSPEITNRRTDSLQTLLGAEELQFFGFAFTNQYSKVAVRENGILVCYKDKITEADSNNLQYDKSSLNIVTRYYEYLLIEGSNTVELKLILDVKNPLWESAYNNVQLGAVGEDKTGVTSATKQYKSYTTSIGDKEYINWICNAMYDIKAFKTDVNKNQHYDGWAIITKDDLVEYEGEEREWYKKAYDIHDNDSLDWFEDAGFFETLPKRVPSNSGFVGPGPVCFLANADTNKTVVENMRKFDEHGVPYIGTAVVNVQHKPIQYAGLSNSDKTLDVYYGFGNFCTIDEGGSINTVFDGDVYIIPFEIVQMFKTYDFNSYDTLQSAQFVYYVPIESPINTYFDYGMNYKNTQSKILQLEPGEISGVSSQDRPLSQYNIVFSDNSTSNDVYNATYNEDQISEFKNRIWFSNQKISGEYIDNWLIYSPLDYTDADSRFGDITCLTSMKDAIYCWQDRSFGRISVNERSLVKDTNSNMIQLGTGGVVQRVDYIDTIHGMSANQYVCENVANRIYWIDDKNKVVMVSDGVNATNLSEHANVQSILNNKFNNTNLTIEYDSQSDELICKCLNDGNLLIFNTKLNLATSVYTRKYLESFRLNNNLYGITKTNNDILLYWFGGIDINETTLTGDVIGDVMTYMPSTIQFVVNDNSSITKVFDNLEIVFSDAKNDISQFDNHSEFQFNTNISNQITNCLVSSTSREGNLRYSIPREQNAEYGNRMRGKWLKVSVFLDGTIKNAISHVITKFRQSF